MLICIKLTATGLLLESTPRGAMPPSKQNGGASEGRKSTVSTENAENCPPNLSRLRPPHACDSDGRQTKDAPRPNRHEVARTVRTRVHTQQQICATKALLPVRGGRSAMWRWWLRCLSTPGMHTGVCTTGINTPKTRPTTSTVKCDRKQPSPGRPPTQRDTITPAAWVAALPRGRCHDRLGSG